MNDVLQDVELKMKQALEGLQQELKALRTGRASISILDGVLVEAYGVPTPLKQVANLSVADASMIVAQPWDPGQIPAIEKAIAKANLGLNPSSDGRVIRIPIPPLTEERRKEMVRRAHQQAENWRNAIRHARRDGNEMLKEMEKEKDISQDEQHRGQDEIQKLHDHYVGLVNDTVKNREKDILTL